MQQKIVCKKKEINKMPRYIATILIDVDEVPDCKKSNKSTVKGLLESRFKPGAINELVFRNGKVVLEIKEVKILVMEID